MQAHHVMRRLTAADIPKAHELEVLSYPEDEAASLHGMLFRQAQAGPFFLGLFDNKTSELLAFINGTLCASTTLEHDTMSTHDPEGSTLCIHSVVVQPHIRKQGLATSFLRAYIEKVLPEHPYTLLRVRLITKAHNVGLYQRCGFIFLRLSPVVHGQEKWFEMGLDRLSLVESEGREGRGRGREYVQVDAFTGEAFGGNPAAVVFCRGDETTEWMQNWAREFNLSETAFVTPSSSSFSSSSSSCFSLRWFTSAVEVDLCGHATLAAAHALWVTGRVGSRNEIIFETLSGKLVAKRKEEEEKVGGGGGGGGGWIVLDFPAEPMKESVGGSEGLKREGEVGKLLGAFGLKTLGEKKNERERRRRREVDGQGSEAEEEEEEEEGREKEEEKGEEEREEEDDIVFVGRNRVDVLAVLTPRAFRLAKKRKPDMAILRNIECRGIIITCHADKWRVGKEGFELNPDFDGENDFDFYSRFFGPRCGIEEDPVTGSAHCFLAPYWHSLSGKNKLVGYQDSERGGMVRMEYDVVASRVYLSGQAVLVKSGWLGV